MFCGLLLFCGSSDKKIMSLQLTKSLLMQYEEMLREMSFEINNNDIKKSR